MEREALALGDGGKLDDSDWYRYSRNQNLDKQAQALCTATTLCLTSLPMLSP